MIDVTSLQVVLIVFVATLIRSAFGFGEALIAVPLLAFFIPLTIAAPLGVLVSITVAIIVVIEDWEKIHLSSAAWLVAATLPGIPLGLLLLASSHQAIVKGVLGDYHHWFFCLLADRANAARTASRQPGMAFFLRAVCGSSWRCFRNERSAPGGLRIDAAVVGTAISRDPASVLSSFEHHWHGGVSCEWAVGARRDALLPAVVATRDSSNLAGQMGEPSPGRGYVLKIRLPGSRGDRSASADSGGRRAGLSARAHSGLCCGRGLGVRTRKLSR